MTALAGRDPLEYLRELIGGASGRGKKLYHHSGKALRPWSSFLYARNSTCAADNRRYKLRWRTIGHQSYRNISIGRQFATHPQIVKPSSMTRLIGRGARWAPAA
jgi:hypothetical protein